MLEQDASDEAAPAFLGGMSTEHGLWGSASVAPSDLSSLWEQEDPHDDPFVVDVVEDTDTAPAALLKGSEHAGGDPECAGGCFCIDENTMPSLSGGVRSLFADDPPLGGAHGECASALPNPARLRTAMEEREAILEMTSGMLCASLNGRCPPRVVQSKRLSRVRPECAHDYAAARCPRRQKSAPLLASSVDTLGTSWQATQPLSVAPGSTHTALCSAAAHARHGVTVGVLGAKGVGKLTCNTRQVRSGGASPAFSPTPPTPLVPRSRSAQQHECELVPPPTRTTVPCLPPFLSLSGVGRFTGMGAARHGGVTVEVDGLLRERLSQQGSQGRQRVPVTPLAHAQRRTSRRTRSKKTVTTAKK